MTKKEILDLIDEIGSEHPYKILGKEETYSQYNEAWADCCDRVARKIDEYFEAKEKHRQKYLVIFMYTDNLMNTGWAQSVVAMDFEDGLTEDLINEIVLGIKRKNIYKEIVILNMIKLDD